MNECSPAVHQLERASAPALVRAAGQEAGHGAYVGLDVHKETIAVALAEPGRGEPVYRGEIANTRKKVAKLIAKLRVARTEHPGPTSVGRCSANPLRIEEVSYFTLCACNADFSNQAINLKCGIWSRNGAKDTKEDKKL